MQIRLPPGPRDRAARCASVLRHAIAKNRKELELLTCVVGLMVGVALGALSMGIAPPPTLAAPAAQTSSSPPIHDKAIRAQQNAMLGL